MLFWFTAASTELRATALSDVAAAVQAGQWAELVTTGFDSATLDDGGAYAVFWYAEDIAWDAARQQLLFVGGGHGSDPEFLTYSEATNAWTRRKPGGGIPWDTYFSETYDHLALIPSLGRLYFRQPAFTPSDRIEIYDIVAGTWTRSPLMPNRPACCGALEYFPELGGLVNVAGPGPVYFYDPAANAWSTLAASVSIGEYHNFAQYSPVHRVMIFGGGEGPNGTALYRMDANRQITRLNNAPQRMGTTYSIVTTDPVSGNFLVFFDNASYQFNPMTQVWTLLPGVPPWRPIGYAGVFAAVATSLPEYGVVLVAKYAGDNSRVYLYRHTASSGPPPTITFSAEPGTVASGGSSVLSWTTTGASNCTGAGGTGAWPGAKSVPNGSETVGPIATTTTFSLSCAGPGGTAQSSVVVSVYPLPAVTLTADPASVIVGETTQLTWSTQNANSCVASGAWAGPRALAGSETSQPLSVNSTFTLECSGVGGSASRHSERGEPATADDQRDESRKCCGRWPRLYVDRRRQQLRRRLRRALERRESGDDTHLGVAADGDHSRRGHRRHRYGTGDGIQPAARWRPLECADVHDRGRTVPGARHERRQPHVGGRRERRVHAHGQRQQLRRQLRGPLERSEPHDNVRLGNAAHGGDPGHRRRREWQRARHCVYAGSWRRNLQLTDVRD
jgi:hypothetical protein